MNWLHLALVLLGLLLGFSGEICESWQRRRQERKRWGKPGEYLLLRPRLDLLPIDDDDLAAVDYRSTRARLLSESTAPPPPPPDSDPGVWVK